MPNFDEIAYWNDEAGSRWAHYQERIDAVFAPLGEAGLTAAAALAGETVVDIGCGCGASSIALSHAVDKTGSVLGVDVSRTMLAVAEERSLAAGLRNSRFLLADASTEAFDEHVFDLAFSRFGVMFFDDPVAAFENVRRSLRPDGRLVFVCWRDLGANPWFTVPMEAIRPHVPPQPKADAEAPGPLAFADATRVRDILERAGFERVRFEAFDAVLPLGTRASATELLSKIGPASRLIEGGSESERARAVLALDDVLSAHESHRRVRLGAGVWIVRARPGHAN